jgi:hypothetical protein
VKAGSIKIQCEVMIAESSEERHTKPAEIVEVSIKIKLKELMRRECDNTPANKCSK